MEEKSTAKMEQSDTDQSTVLMSRDGELDVREEQSESTLESIELGIKMELQEPKVKTNSEDLEEKLVKESPEKSVRF